jgi:hypothetical protein
LLINDSGLSSSSSKFDGYSLYYVSDKATLISDGVYSVKLSASGKGVAYVKELDSNDREGELHLWRGGKTERISDSIYIEYSYCISPDGKTAAFVTGSSDDYEGVYYNGSINKLGDSIEPFAIADKAKYVYYEKNSSSYVMITKDGSKLKLADLSSYFFNKDLSQILYSDSDSGKTYAVLKGEEKKSLSGSIYAFIAPNNTQYYNHVYGIKSFANTLYVSDGGDIIRIDSKFETSSVAKKISESYIYLASDGKTLIYRKNDDIYKVNALKKEPSPEKLVNGDVIMFLAVNKGSAVYFANNENELYYQKGKGEPELIGDDIDLSSSYAYYSYISVFKDKTLYYISDGELYSSTGKKGKVISSFDDDVELVGGGSFTIWARTEDSAYSSSDGKKWTLQYDIE